MKRLAYIFIPILAILLMSHNANALDLTLNLDNYESIRHTDEIPIICRLNGDGLTTTAYSCGNNNVLDVNYLQEIRYATDYHWSNNGGVKKGDLLEWYLVVFTNGYYTLDSNLRGPFYLNTYSYLDTISFKKISSSENYHIWHMNCPFSDGTLSTLCESTDGYRYYNVYQVIQRVNTDLNSRWTYGLNVSGNYHIFEWNNQNTSFLRFRMMNFNQYRFVGSAENKEQAEATQDAADDSQDAGDDSTSDAETATSSLISVIGGFVNVVTSATPTNCKINAYTDHLDMGNIDLCANPVPSYIQIIGSIILICAVIPLAIILFNRFIGLFRSFQG